MTRKACALVQHSGTWYTVNFSVRGRQIADVHLRAADTHGGPGPGPAAGPPCSVALDDSSGYLVDLSFPFAGKRRISSVIGGELEERLPFPSEELAVAFKEMGAGRVLSAAVPLSVLEGLNDFGRIRHVTLQSLAALFALRWLNVIDGEDFVFLYAHNGTAVLLAFRQNTLHSVRQFFCGSDYLAVDDALRETLKDQGFGGSCLFLVTEGDDAGRLKDRFESTLGIEVKTPSLVEYVPLEHIPAWAWAAIGSGLLSLDGKDEINLCKQARTALPPWNRYSLWVMGGLAGLSTLVWGLLCLDYYLKVRVDAYLSREPYRIYALSFPKTPLPRDAARAFQAKIASLGQETGTGAPSAGALFLLNELSSRIDGTIDVKLSDFSLEDNEFSLGGTTVSFAAIEKIKAAIEQIPGVGSVDVASVDLDQDRQVRFKIRGGL